MSSAAAVSSSAQSSNPSPKFDAGFVSKPGTSEFPGRSRRKPRLVKVRKQSGPKESSSNRVDPVPKSLDHTVFFGASKSDSATSNTNSENLSANKSNLSGIEGFVFGDSKSYSGLNSNFANLGFVFGTNNDTTCSFKFNSKVRNGNRTNKNSSGNVLYEEPGNEGFVFGASSTSSSRFNSSNENGDRTNKSNSVSYLNEEPACSESNGYSRSNLDFEQRKSSGNAGLPHVVNGFKSAFDSKLEQSESHKIVQPGTFHFGKVANGSTLQSDILKSTFVFGASGPNFNLRNGERNKDEAYREAESQGPMPNGTFVFGCGVKGRNKDENGKHAEDMDNLNREKSQNHNGFWSAQKSDLGADGKLKFSSSSGDVADVDLPKTPIFKLSDEMNSLNIGSAPVEGAEKTNYLNKKSGVNTQNVFVFGLNQHTSNVSTESATCNSCDQPKDVNVKDLGSSSCADKADTTDGEPNAKKACASELDESFASSLKGSKDKSMPGETVDTNAKIGLSSEQINSISFSAGTSGKENQPINFNSSLNIDMERSRMPFPLFTPEGSQHEVDMPEALSSHHAEKKEEFSFPSTQFTPVKHFSDFNASNSDNSFSFTTNLFSGVNGKSGCGTSSRLRDKKVKKKKTLRQRTLVQQLAGQTDLSDESSSKHNNESPGCCSPMDFSPYQDTNSSTSAGNANEGVETKEDVVAAKEAPVFSGCEEKRGEGTEKLPGSDSGKDSASQGDFSSYTSPSAQDGLSSIRRQYRKKYKLKVDGGPKNLNHKNVDLSSDTVQPSSFGRNFSADIQSGVKSHVRSKGIHASKADKDHGKLGLTDREVCEQWRIRGNQAYKAGNLSQAEDFYTKGIKSVSVTEISGSCLEPLLLCYSNLAATHMSLKRMREAISDCASAAALDPHFLKVKLRAANCYLVLGEVEEAIQYYNNCLESRINLCLDRRITIEAADGLQKAQRVSEHMHRCAELLQHRTSDAAKSALEITKEALSISCYSEKLLEMKGEAFCMLQMYKQVIELCENTLDIAEKNFTSDLANSSLRLWRWHLMSRSYFHLGKLEVALDLIEKQERMVSVGKRSGNMTQESTSPLAVTIRELLHRKKAGNEAFKSGKYTEAIEHYTASISSSVESRPFAAICFCNRAAAHQALGQIVDAIADCSIAIALDKNYTKAVSRRATLHEMIRDYAHAVNDLERLISLQEIQSQERTRQSEALDKSNGSSTKEAKRTRRQLLSVQEKAKLGIPLDLYLILGIKSSDTEPDIKKAYRKAALRHHPDKAGQILARSDAGDDGGLWKEISETVRKDADRLFKLIGEAYAVLSDSDKRSKHDLEEEIRDVQRDSTRNSDCCSPSDSYSSQFERTNWSRRQTNFYSSPFGRSGTRRYGQEYWRTYGESHPRW